MYAEDEPLQEIDDYTDQLQDLKNRNKDIVSLRFFFLSFFFFSTIILNNHKNGFFQDKELEDIGKGLEVLKEIAVNMNQELETQNQMIDEIEHKVEKAGAKLGTLNIKLQQTLDKVMKGDRFLMTFILVCLLLAIIGFIASMFALLGEGGHKKKNKKRPRGFTRDGFREEVSFAAVGTVFG